MATLTATGEAPGRAGPAGSGLSLLAYRFALDPTPAQERGAAVPCGRGPGRVQLGLARVKVNLGQRAAEKSYGITGDKLTPPLSWSLYSLRKDWNAAKDTVAPWWAECSKEAYSTGLDGLARALGNWSDSRKGKRKGKPAGFPRFRSKRKARLSVRFTTGAFRCEARHAVLPRIGRVKLHEDGRRLADLVAAGTARVRSVTVWYERGRWFVSFAVETVVSRPAPRHRDAVAGVDLGIKTLAVLSTGETASNPRYLSGALRKLRRLSRTVFIRPGCPAGRRETSTRHAQTRSDRDRPRASRDCDMSTAERSGATDIFLTRRTWGPHAGPQARHGP